MKINSNRYSSSSLSTTTMGQPKLKWDDHFPEICLDINCQPHSGAFESSLSRKNLLPVFLLVILVSWNAVFARAPSISVSVI